MTFIISGVLGVFPLTREHCNTKCVSRDGQVDIGKSVFRDCNLCTNLKYTPFCSRMEIN